MVIEYTPRGVCSRKMTIQVEDGKIINAEVIGGCNGNLKGICSLIKGMEVTHAISCMEGVTCGPKPTSCPDQLAQALKQAL